MKKVLYAALIALLLFSCSAIKNTSCSTPKSVQVTVISDYGTYRIKIPYCDTVYIGGKKQPDSIYFKYKTK